MNLNLEENNEHLLEFVEGETIFVEGQVERNIYIINSGIIKLHKINKGKGILFALLGKGRLFGKFVLFDDEPKAIYSANSLDNSRILVFENVEYREILKRDQNICFETFKQFYYNNRDNLMILSDLVYKGEISHIVASFLSYRRLHGVESQSDDEIVLSKERISDLTCVKGDELERMIDMLLKMKCTELIKRAIFIITPC